MWFCLHVVMNLVFEIAIALSTSMGGLFAPSFTVMIKHWPPKVRNLIFCLANYGGNREQHSVLCLLSALANTPWYQTLELGLGMLMLQSRHSCC